MCCGRAIVRCFELTNLVHDEKVRLDPGYTFPAKIVIGCICGPTLFAESCRSFYDDPGMQWAREFALYKDYVKYITLCIKNSHVWDNVPDHIREPVDEFLDGKWKLFTNGEHTGMWWRARDAKRKILSLGNTKRGTPTPTEFAKRVSKLKVVAEQLGIIPTEQSTLQAVEKNVA